MEVHELPSVTGNSLELDLCFACHGMWFDPKENLKLTPGAVMQLFGMLHAHRNDVRHPLAMLMACPHCRQSLQRGFDQVRSGRYITYRCANGHGRFSAFSSFMIEKGFVRHLTRPEIDDIAQRVGVISCTGCGAPVDLRKDHACPHCRSAFSLLDPAAVERALQGYARAEHQNEGLKIPQLADALVMVERDRQAALRDAKRRGDISLPGDTSPRFDLWALGLGLVGGLLR